MKSRMCILVAMTLALCRAPRPLEAGLLDQAMSPSPSLECRNTRSGCSQCLACYAHPGRSPRETGYYVGGGAALHGACRCCDEGTWGWDYAGWIPRRIQLNWWHGKRYQGGTGAYKTDGPHLLNRE
jgi:hypothetical protein